MANHIPFGACISTSFCQHAGVPCPRNCVTHLEQILSRHKLVLWDAEGRGIPWNPAQPRPASPGARVSFDDLAAPPDQDQQRGRQEQARHAPGEDACGAPVLSLSGAGHASTIAEDVDMLELMLDMGLL